jgi:hypothetical protein
MTSVTNGPSTGPMPQTGTRPVPPPKAGLRRASRAPVQGSPEGLPMRRRWGRFAAGVVLATLGAWVFASLYISAGERVEVLAMARDVGRFEEIQRDDLRVVRVAAGQGVDTIRAGRADELVGRVAGTGLREGSLLSPNQLFPEDHEVLEPNERIVPLELPRTSAPEEAWEPGMEVTVVMRPGSAASGATTDDPQIATAEGCWIYDIGEVDEETRTLHVDLVVPDYEADDVAAAALEEGRVGLILHGGG